MSLTSSAEMKAVMRRLVLGQRRTAHERGNADAAAAVTQRLLQEINPNGKKIAGYWPLGDELDCRGALTALAAAGAQVALPVVAGQGQVLIFRAWTPGDALESGPFGTHHPPMRAALVQPEILLLPLIAFDRRGHRLGYGAGYYDRTVSALRAQHSIVALGVAYDEQEVEAVPADQHDQVMDGIITTGCTLWFNPAAQQRAR